MNVKKHRRSGIGARLRARVKVKRGTKQADRFAHGSFARFFNSANARPARRPSLVAVEFELLGVVCAARLESGEPAAEAGELIRR